MDKDILAVALTILSITAIVLIAAFFTKSITGKQALLMEQTVNCPLADLRSCNECCERIGGRNEDTLCRYVAAPFKIQHSQTTYNSCVQYYGYSLMLTK